ncbi:MAG: Type IV pilus assembly protein PilM [Candidatus Roizmanbacteria bacterium GW2011_GWA2_37_7]|uniref:Type IV pilus assembly protein PilM n=1 Tax=Candidatus Roizmanbacteria bacterium GW2011_GWA2_37_7 TaxID=1618481 RepID=A0A0G0JPD0_9BACT|nr:MAG: Type IV pilus assembly protein PilM [Candidatus Roizmanbacteria bacterium GW2011_GWA2_37_7]
MASTFSIDISEQYTRVADMVLNKGKIELYSLGYDNTALNFYTNLTDQSAKLQAQLLSELRKELIINSSVAHVVIPDSLTYSQLLLMPNLPEDELVKSIRLQADEFVPLPIDDVYIDLEVVSKLQNNKLLIVFIAAQKKIVDHINMTLNLAGIEPGTLENELSAVGRFVSEVYTFIKTPSLIINFGFGSSSMYVMTPPFPYFQITRTSRIGFDIILRDLVANSNLTSDKAFQALSTIGLSTKGSINIYATIFPVMNELFAEIEKTILMAKEKYHVSIQNVFLFNYDSYIALLHETIQSKVSLPTQSLPLSSILVPNLVTQTFSHMLSTFIPVIATHLR